jgi:hypothetical protein
VSRNFKGGAIRISVFEGEPLNPSDETAAPCKAFRIGESHRPLDGII